MPETVENLNCANIDFADVHGQFHVKRAFEIAATGSHNLLMLGPPGTGKSMLASRLPTIVPELTEQQAQETAAIASISDKGFDVKNWLTRLFARRIILRLLRRWSVVAVILSRAKFL